MANAITGAVLALVLACAAFDTYRTQAIDEGIATVAMACNERGHYDAGTIRIACSIVE